MNLFYLIYLLCSCTNLVFGKIFVPEIWATMLSANQIAGFFDQPYLQSKLIKEANFLPVVTNSYKLKIDENFLCRHHQKWVWPVLSQDSKIDCISGMN